MDKIIDYISGKEIIASPEEIEATQPLSKELHQIYGYSKKDIVTRPQVRVKKSPSDKIGVPIDIAVYEGKKLKIVAECKRLNSTDGLQQLKDYLSMCEAQWGILYNGETKVFLKKLITDTGIEYEEVLEIPHINSNTIERRKKKDLRPFGELKILFKEIRNFLATTTVGKTAESAQAEEFIKILFSKIFDERFKDDDDYTDFYLEEEGNKERINLLFDEVKKLNKSLFSPNESITLNEEQISFVISRLQDISFMKSSRDSITDAFEVFLTSSLKGGHGQYFTPRNVTQFIIKYLDMEIDSKVMDPAVGTGGFVVEAMRIMWDKISDEFKNLSDKLILEKQRSYASENIWGMDIDSFVSKVAKSYMTILGDGTSNIKNGDSLCLIDNKDYINKFDYIITNPPYGKEITIKDKNILAKYELGMDGTKVRKSVEPQILFIELVINLLKPGGRAAIVLPEGVYGNSSSNHVRKFIVENGSIDAVISLPSETFMPHTGVKTSVLIFTKGKEQGAIEFITINKIGHDKDGKILYKTNAELEITLDDNGDKIVDDELVDVLKTIKNKSKNYKDSSLQNYFNVDYETIEEHDLFLSSIFYQDFLQFTSKLEEKKGYDLKSIQDLIDEGIIQTNKNGNISTGDGILSSQYIAGGEVPFVRTSDIRHFEITHRPPKTTSVSVYEAIKEKQDVQPWDLLLNKDGDHLVGEMAPVLPGREKIIYQSHIYKFRILENKYGIDTINFMDILNEDYVRKQFRAIIFKQGTIPTIGQRFRKIKIYIDKDAKKNKEKSDKIKKKLLERDELYKSVFD